MAGTFLRAQVTEGLALCRRGRRPTTSPGEREAEGADARTTADDTRAGGPGEAGRKHGNERTRGRGPEAQSPKALKTNAKRRALRRTRKVEKSLTGAKGERRNALGATGNAPDRREQPTQTRGQSPSPQRREGMGREGGKLKPEGAPRQNRNTAYRTPTGVAEPACGQLDAERHEA